MKNNIRILRRSPEYDLSQEELAIALGTTRDRISAIENGAIPGGKLMIKICIFFNRDIRDIFFTEDVVCTIQKVKKKRQKHEPKKAIRSAV
ncbi:helix-turn-helix transcriptional regulator [Brevibacillus sp. DP1.3A]|uniref:helix-turn-helix transcriptional regulator n=1 Tax=Brevibacillus sp. DP1.3A TaxID=2738867 RepID=UPI00156B7009|nr:helix-turn-helix domain-containing protein [Brevibacillus sp. DP1.3A]UED76073.1 helix-turn-helix domain-containing protein [Brevibacillus sp. DP1.3A]